MDDDLVLLRSQIADLQATQTRNSAQLKELMEDRKSLVKTGLIVLGGTVVALIVYIWGLKIPS